MVDTNTETGDENVVLKPAKEVPVVQDEGFFQHSTGDTYNGYFEAKKKDRIVKMHGHGTYKTVEGDVYTGLWDNDKLGNSETVTIAYSDKSSYEGFLKDWCYSGPGTYTYPDESTLICDFSENCPVGNLKLRDPNGHMWLGKAEYAFGWLEPVNHFYEALESTKDSTIVKKHRRVKE